MEDRPGVFACLRCKSRKIKCDREMPKCTNCERTRSPCLINDPSTGRHVPRSYLNHLEARVKQLEFELETARQVTSTSIPAYNWIPESELPYHGTSSGFSVAIRLAQELNDNGNQVKFDSLRHLITTGKPFVNVLKDPWCLPINLTSKREAEVLIKWYFEQCNATFPIFHREQFIQQYFEPVYGSISPDLELCSKHTVLDLQRSSLEPGTGTFYRRWVDCGNSMAAAPEPRIQNCLYFLYMVFALGTVTNNRVSSRNPLQGPQYLAAAMNYYSAAASGRTKDDQCRSLQAILILSLYGIMMPMSSSAWYTIGNAMRMCIHMGLHNEDELDNSGEDMFFIDMRRRLFWTTYMLDRVISLNLGRPVSILDEYVKCELPSLADDSWLKPSCSNPPKAFNPPDRPSYKWVFHTMLSLRKLQHKIQFTLYDQKKRGDPSAMRLQRDKYIDELDYWHQTIPWNIETFNFNWNVNVFELNYNYTRILLYRNSPQIPHPTMADFGILIDACVKLLKIYVGFVENLYLVYTWTAVYNILQASASCLYALYQTNSLNQTFDLDAFESLMSNVKVVMDQLAKACEAAKPSTDSLRNMVKVALQYLRQSNKRTHSDSVDVNSDDVVNSKRSNTKNFEFIRSENQSEHSNFDQLCSAKASASNHDRAGNSAIDSSLGKESDSAGYKYIDIDHRKDDSGTLPYPILKLPGIFEEDRNY